MTRNTIYNQPLNEISGFAFDDRMVNVFPGMIGRSVPDYKTIISAIDVLADKLTQPGSHFIVRGLPIGCGNTFHSSSSEVWFQYFNFASLVTVE